MIVYIYLHGDVEYTLHALSSPSTVFYFHAPIGKLSELGSRN